MTPSARRAGHTPLPTVSSTSTSGVERAAGEDILGCPGCQYQPSTSSSGRIQNPALAEHGGRERARHARSRLELVARPDQDILGYANALEYAVGPLVPPVSPKIREWDNHKQVVVALRTGLAAPARSKQIDPFGSSAATSRRTISLSFRSVSSIGSVIPPPVPNAPASYTGSGAAAPHPHPSAA